jgi:hypothetical protein
MTRPLPPGILPPARADLGSAAFAPRDARPSADRGDGLSLTVIVEEHADRSARRFAFRASRQTEPLADRRSDNEQVSSPRLMIAGAQSRSAAILDRHDVRSSARFLASAIAQARPAAVLHNPPYRYAAMAYRRSDALGTPFSIPHPRSDKRI